MRDQECGIDIIADIHGHYRLLEKLLEKLGCRRLGEMEWDAPKGRKLAFLGDLIDRGSKSVPVVKTVRSMVGRGQALCIMGNHEFNAVCWSMRGPNGEYLREHSEAKERVHRAFLDEAGEGSPLHRELLGWFSRLPLWIDLGKIRLVHACFDPASMLSLSHLLDERHRPLSEAFFQAASVKGSTEEAALTCLCKGPEAVLPEGYAFTDKDGTTRREVRIKWWLTEKQSTYREMAMVGEDQTSLIPTCPFPSETYRSFDITVPTFIGHYWLDASSPKRPLSSKVACLDYSAGKGGPLVAYRWNGEPSCHAENFVWVEPQF